MIAMARLWGPPALLLRGTNSATTAEWVGIRPLSSDPLRSWCLAVYPLLIQITT